MQIPAPNADILAWRHKLLAQITLGLPDGAIIESAVELKACECNGLAAQSLDLVPVVCAPKGQPGFVTEATLRIIPKPEGARPVVFARPAPNIAGACVAEIIAAGVLPVAIEFMNGPCSSTCEAFAHEGYGGQRPGVIGAPVQHKEANS